MGNLAYGCNYEQIKRVILNAIETGSKNFAIYPFGRWGKAVKKILDEQEGISYIVIDEKLSDKENDIYRLNILQEKSYLDYIVLLCSDSIPLYRELRIQILKYTNIRNVIDVCLQDDLFSELRFTEPRLAAFECACREILDRDIKGNLAEAGVFTGEFAKYINAFFPQKKFYLIDTFEGFDDRDVKIDRNNLFSDGNQDWRDTSVELVLSKMIYAENCIVKKVIFLIP